MDILLVREKNQVQFKFHLEQLNHIYTGHRQKLYRK